MQLAFTRARYHPVARGFHAAALLEALQVTTSKHAPSLKIEKAGTRDREIKQLENGHRIRNLHCTPPPSCTPMGACCSSEFQDVDKASLALMASNQSVIESEVVFEDAYNKMLSLHFNEDHDADFYHACDSIDLARFST